MSVASARDPRVRPFGQHPGGRTLAFAVLQAIGDAGVVPCLACGGRTHDTSRGVECGECGSVLERQATVVTVG